MQATISKILENGKPAKWKVEIGMYHVACFPITTPKSALLTYATDNGADDIKFLITV